MTMTTKRYVGLVFAALGYMAVVAIGLLPTTAKVSSWMVLCAAPVLFLTATVDPSWTTLLIVLAPLNAALYAAVAVAVRFIIHNGKEESIAPLR